MEAMKAADMAARISGQMLTYLGQTAGEKKTVDLSEIYRLAAPMLEAALPRDVYMETDFPSPGPAIQANPGEIQQVLANLVANASEAVSEKGGEISVSLQTVSASDIPSTYRFPVDWAPKDVSYACLEVRDTGPGIPQQDVDRLFDPFYTTKFTGRGLGLSVAMGIVRAHGGCITVESRIGTQKGEGGDQWSEVRDQRSEVGDQRSEVRGRRSETLGVFASLRENPLGSVFRVFLPLAAEAEGRLAQTEAKSPDLAGGGTVLLVEDEAQVRKLGVRMLQHLGLRVLEAKDGVEGIELLRAHRDEIGFVICDLTMPRMDGWETIAGMRRIKPDIPVILASGYDEASVMSGNHPEVPQVFLAKPYGLEDLTKAIRKVDENPLMPNEAPVRGPKKGRTSNIEH
jgi:CheY-like chemotaxis protein